MADLAPAQPSFNITMGASEYIQGAYAELEEVRQEVCHHAGNGDVIGVELSLQD